MLEEYIVAQPESFECMVEVAELCLEFPSELLLLLLLAVSNIPAQIFFFKKKKAKFSRIQANKRSVHVKKEQILTFSEIKPYLIFFSGNLFFFFQ